MYEEWSSIRIGLELFNLTKVIKGEYEAHVWGAENQSDRILYAYNEFGQRHAQLQELQIREKAEHEGIGGVAYLGQLTVAQARKEITNMEIVLERRIVTEIITHRYVRPVRNFQPREEYL